MFSLQASGRFLLNALLIATSFWLLLPTTLTFGFGLFASTAAIFELNGSWVFFTALLMLPGLGLGAVWWLTFAFPFIKGIHSIPRAVRVCLLLGITCAMYILIWTAHARFAIERLSISWAKAVFLETLDFGGGPLAASILLIAGIWLRQLYAEKCSRHHAS